MSRRCSAGGPDQRGRGAARAGRRRRERAPPASWRARWPAPNVSAGRAVHRPRQFLRRNVRAVPGRSRRRRPLQPGRRDDHAGDARAASRGRRQGRWSRPSRSSPLPCGDDVLDACLAGRRRDRTAVAGRAVPAKRVGADPDQAARPQGERARQDRWTSRGRVLRRSAARSSLERRCGHRESELAPAHRAIARRRARELC